MINLRVLFADGDADVRKIVALSLQRDALFVVCGCASGTQALKMVREWRPDLALLGVSMPGMDGPALLACMRAEKRTAAIPVVFATAPDQDRKNGYFHALGAVGVIEKPFDPLRLAGELRRFVACEGPLAAARENFLQRLEADARVLSACREWLSRAAPEAVLVRINQIAHALAGAGGIYGFAGIGCESAALADAVENCLAGRATKREVAKALDRLVTRIGCDERPMRRSRAVRERRVAQRYSAATA